MKKIAMAKTSAPMPYVADERYLAKIPCAMVPNKRPTPSFSATSAIRFFCPLSTNKTYQRGPIACNLNKFDAAYHHPTKVRKRTKRGDWPVEQPMTVEVVFNRAITVAPWQLMRAETVIKRS